MKKNIYLIALSFCALCLYTFSQAIADGPGDITGVRSVGQMYANGCNSPASKGCDNDRHIYDALNADSFSIPRYVRSSVKAQNFQWQYTVPPEYPEGGGNQGVYNASGEYSCNGQASWRFRQTGGGNCWNSHTLYSAENCEGRRNVAHHSARQPGNNVVAQSICSSGVCVLDYQPASSRNHFIIGATGDNMAAILPYSNGTKGFLVNNFCGGVPYWLERTSYEGSKYMVLPSKCSDYQTFINARPAGISISNACHPVNLRICPAPPARPAMPAHPSCGGHAHGSSWCSGSWVTEESCSNDAAGVRRCRSYQRCTRYSSCDCGSVR